MRSPKSELYLFVKSLIKGGTYDDNGTDIVCAGVSDIEYFMFWNSELINSSEKDGYPVPAVFFEYTEAGNPVNYQLTGDSDSVGRTKDDVTFILHVISPKVNSELREEDYLQQIDLVTNVRNTIQDKSFSKTSKIKKVSELQDNDSSVLMDWQLTFTVSILNCGITELVDANNIAVNINAPVEHVVSVDVDTSLFN